MAGIRTRSIILWRDKTISKFETANLKETRNIKEQSIEKQVGIQDLADEV
jgi:hypothetical protein